MIRSLGKYLDPISGCLSFYLFSNFSRKFIISGKTTEIVRPCLCQTKEIRCVRLVFQGTRLNLSLSLNTFIKLELSSRSLILRWTALILYCSDFSRVTFWSTWTSEDSQPLCRCPSTVGTLSDDSGDFPWSLSSTSLHRGVLSLEDALVDSPTTLWLVPFSGVSWSLFCDTKSVDCSVPVTFHCSSGK